MCVSVTVGTEEQKGWNASPSWEAGMAREGSPGTEPSKMRPEGCTGVGRGKGQKQDERSSVELKGLRVSDGGDVGYREGRREAAESGWAAMESGEPC